MLVGTGGKREELKKLTGLVLISLSALYLRIDGFRDIYSGRLLWAEDAPVFMGRAAADSGLAMLFEPYAGYLHLYPRLVAWIGNLVPLAERPGIYFAGWLLVYVFVSYVVAKAARIQGMGWYAIGALLIAIACQPHNGEALFNITNAQWILGVALIFVVMTDLPPLPVHPLAGGVLLLVMALTGPFSIFLVPVMALKAAGLKDFAQRKTVYVPVALGAAVQLFFILRSGRATQFDGVAPLDHFLFTIAQVLCFGATTMIGYVAVAVFWCVLLIGLRQVEHLRRRPLLFLLAAVGLLYLGELYSVRISPLSSVAFSVGTRFTWIPYTTLFFVAFAVTHGRRVLRWLLVFALAGICVPLWQPMGNHDYGFRSLAKLSAWRAVDIPINPGFFTVHGKPEKSVSEEQMPFAIFPYRTSWVSTMSSIGDMEFVADTREPTIMFSAPAQCKKATDLVVALDITRNVEGPVQLFWNSVYFFSEKRSTRQWYKAGRVQIELGFPVKSETTYLRFDPMDGAGTVKIHDIKVYCLS